MCSQGFIPLAALFSDRTTMMRLLNQLRDDEGGQDLIEYALLGGFIGLACVAAMSLLSGSMETAYQAWSAEVQSDALVEMPNPAAP